MSSRTAASCRHRALTSCPCAAIVRSVDRRCDDQPDRTARGGRRGGVALSACGSPKGAVSGGKGSAAATLTAPSVVATAGPSGGATFAKYSKIKIGMTYQQVVRSWVTRVQGVSAPIDDGRQGGHSGEPSRRDGVRVDVDRAGQPQPDACHVRQNKSRRRTRRDSHRTHAARRVRGTHVHFTVVFNSHIMFELSYGLVFVPNPCGSAATPKCPGCIQTSRLPAWRPEAIVDLEDMTCASPWTRELPRSSCIAPAPAPRGTCQPARRYRRAGFSVQTLRLRRAELTGAARGRHDRGHTVGSASECRGRRPRRSRRGRRRHC